MNYWLDKIKTTGADGVDFFDLNGEHLSFLTKQELEDGAAAPRAQGKLWILQNGKKAYINDVIERAKEDFGDNTQQIEILGYEIEPALEHFKIPYTKTYEGEEISVYKISVSGLMKLCEVPDEKWKIDWGWWRYCEGSILRFTPTHVFTINELPMVGYYNEDYNCGSYNHSYQGIRSYLCDAIGASTEKNVCAISMDLARLNGLTLGELFTKYTDK